MEKTPEFNCVNISFGGYVSTPFFPISYSDDLTFEHVVNCNEPVCLIYLIFVDFQIAEKSIVEACKIICRTFYVTCIMPIAVDYDVLL